MHWLSSLYKTHIIFLKVYLFFVSLLMDTGIVFQLQCPDCMKPNIIWFQSSIGMSRIRQPKIAPSSPTLNLESLISHSIQNSPWVEVWGPLCDTFQLILTNNILGRESVLSNMSNVICEKSSQFDLISMVIGQRSFHKWNEDWGSGHRFKM